MARIQTSIHKAQMTQIPSALRNQTNWLTYRKYYDSTNDDYSYSYFNASTGEELPRTNGHIVPVDYTAAMAVYEDPCVGLAFRLEPESGLTVVEKRNCTFDDTGTLDNGSFDLVDKLSSYTEWDESGTTLRIWIYSGTVTLEDYGDTSFLREGPVPVSGEIYNPDFPLIERREKEARWLAGNIDKLGIELGEIIAVNAVTPRRLSDSFEYYKPEIWRFTEPWAIREMGRLMRSDSKATAAVIDTYLSNLRCPNETRKLIRNLILLEDKKIEGRSADLETPLSYYENHPPERPQFQHPSILPLEGVTVLAGRPKMGKSNLALALSLAMSTGGLFLSKFEIAHPGPVLFYALEDTPSRMDARAVALSNGARRTPNLRFNYRASNLAATFIDELQEWVDKIAFEIAPPRMVVVDILGYIQTPYNGDGSIYDSEYRDMQRLSDFAYANHLNILLVTHLSKRHTTVVDMRDAIMSSTAISGGASTLWVLTSTDSEDNEAKLMISGKDVPMWDLGIRRLVSNGQMEWHCMEDDDGLQSLSKTRIQVLKALFQWQGTPPSIPEFHAQIFPNRNRTTFYKLLNRMKLDELITLVGRELTLTNKGAEMYKATLTDDDDDAPF
jgi:hypothetical protein